MLCGKRNCLLCKAIHTPLSCKEYQENLKIKATGNEEAQEKMKITEVIIISCVQLYYHVKIFQHYTSYYYCFVKL